jgi:glycerol-3-phosphate dehydrogenase
MAMAAEGIPTTAGAYHAARRQNVETPIIDAIHALLEGEKTAAQGMRELMARQLRSEEDF